MSLPENSTSSEQEENPQSKEQEILSHLSRPTEIELVIKAAYLFTTDGKPLISIRWVDTGTPKDSVIGSFVAAIINFGGKSSENKPRNIILRNAKFVFLKRSNYIAVATGSKYAKVNMTERFLEQAIPANEERLDRKEILEHFISAVIGIVGPENMKHIGVGDDLNDDEIQLIYERIQKAAEQLEKSNQNQQSEPVITTFPKPNGEQEKRSEEINNELIKQLDEYFEKKKIAQEYLRTFCREEPEIRNLILVFPSEYEGIDVIIAGEKDVEIANRVTEVITADLTTPVLICTRSFEDRILEIQNHYILLQGIKETDAFIIGIINNPAGKEKYLQTIFEELSKSLDHVFTSLIKGRFV